MYYRIGNIIVLQDWGTITTAVTLMDQREVYGAIQWTRRRDGSLVLYLPAVRDGTCTYFIYIAVRESTLYIAAMCFRGMYEPMLNRGLTVQHLIAHTKLCHDSELNNHQDWKQLLLQPLELKVPHSNRKIWEDKQDMWTVD